MSEKKHHPVAITTNFYQLGTPDFPAYLSLGNDAMIIEGGTSATYAIIVDQVKELGIKPSQIKYLTLTHTHPDHIGSVPYLRHLWPHLKVVGSAMALKLLNRVVEKEEARKEFIMTDRNITRVLISRGYITESPQEPESYAFGVDMVVKEGDKIDLGAGVVWTVYETPGHSPCHIALHDEKGGTLVSGDVTGLYDPGKDLFWPNYFESLEVYCNSIKKMARLSARRVALSHNGVIEGDSRVFFTKALKATEAYHLDFLARLNRGEDVDKIAQEKAKWVTSFTALLPDEAMVALTKLTLRRSQAAASNDNLFTLP